MSDEVLTMERKIREAGLHNTIIRYWLDTQRANNLTWQETLEYIVMSLVEQNEHYHKEILKYAMNNASPYSTIR